MIDIGTIKKGWSLLNEREKRNAVKVLGLMIVAAFASATMVGSVFPFLSVLSDPGLIERTAVLNWASTAFGFQTSYAFLLALGIGAIAVILVANAILVLNAYVLVRFTTMRVHSISRRLFAHYLAQPYAFFLNRHSGNMSTSILAESQQVVNTILRPTAELISSTLTTLAIVATLVLVSPVVATVTILTFCTIYGGLVLTTRHFVRRLGERRMEANRARFRLTGEAFGGIKDLKLLGRERSYAERFDTPSREFAYTEATISVISTIPYFALQALAFGGIVILCLVLLDPAGLEGREALGGVLPLVGLLAFAGQKMMPELNRIYHAVNALSSGRAVIDGLHADLSIPAAPIPHDTPSPLGLRERLDLAGVAYTYPEADRAGLAGIDLSIRAGERIGIVGSSGAGKTTLADVVLGLLVPQDGEIRVDGVPIGDANRRAWQRSVGYVPQDIFLSDASLSENIALGLPPERIDQQKVERAARIARIHDFAVTDLPEGYATRIGERGVRLSGGQRQRIGIARALYHDADLIVFDEATSALDNLTEQEVMAAIEALPGDKTLLVIAHRLSTVQKLDRIVVMQGGRVEGTGRWDELIDGNAAFRQLARVA